MPDALMSSLAQAASPQALQQSEAPTSAMEMRAGMRVQHYKTKRKGTVIWVGGRGKVVVLFDDGKEEYRGRAFSYGMMRTVLRAKQSELP